MVRSLENLLGKFVTKAPKFICGRYFTPGFIEGQNLNSFFIFNDDIDCFFYNTRQLQFWDSKTNPQDLYTDSGLCLWCFDSRNAEGLILATPELRYGERALDGRIVKYPLLAETDKTYLPGLANYIWKMSLSHQPITGSLIQFKPIIPAGAALDKTKVKHWRSLHIDSVTGEAPTQPLPIAENNDTKVLPVRPQFILPAFLDLPPAPSQPTGTVAGSTSLSPTGPTAKKPINFTAVTGSRSLDLAGLGNKNETDQLTPPVVEENSRSTADTKPPVAPDKTDSSPDSSSGSTSKYWLG
jgi:hypothetical protein